MIYTKPVLVNTQPKTRQSLKHLRKRVGYGGLIIWYFIFRADCLMQFSFFREVENDG